jgi:hypothetical protein
VLDIRPISRESIDWIEGIPFASVRVKLYKVISLNKYIATYFNKQSKPPLDTVMLVLFYLLVSFLPSLVLSVLYSLCFSKKNKEMPRSGFVFNQQDMNDIQIILKLVKDLQSGGNKQGSGAE